MKPVETGCKVIGGRLIPEDTIRLISTSGVDESLERVNPYRFRLPLAPAVAAEFEKTVIRKKKILSAFNYLVKKYNITIVEGAGGIMVPVYKKYLILDLIKDMDIPVIIVSKPTLGTINHTCLTIEAARNRGIDIVGVIINYTTKTRKTLAEKTNPELIEVLTKISVLGVIPYSKDSIYPIKKTFLEIARTII
jgi:dethiobiotin synthetase